MGVAVGLGRLCALAAVLPLGHPSVATPPCSCATCPCPCPEPAVPWTLAVADSMVQVFRHWRPPAAAGPGGDEGATIALAQNEREAVQLVVPVDDWIHYILA